MNIENLTDDVLSAYLDGELSPEARGALERQLLSEPGARVRLERFRESDARLRRAFALPGSAEADPLGRLLASDAPPSETASPPSTQPYIPFDRRSRYAAPLGFAMAAAVTGLAIGLVWRGGGLSDSDSAKDPGIDPRMSASLQTALDRQSSGAAQDGTRILFSFRRADGSICRQFETAIRDGSAEGVACRQTDAGWSLVVWHQLEKTTDGYRMAGAGDSPVDAVVEQIDVSGPLSAEDEAEAIRGGR